MSIPRDFARVLRERRSSLGYSQSECAEMAGVSPGWVSRFENGKATCPLNVVCDLADALGVTFSMQACDDQAASIAGRADGESRP